MRIVDNDSHWLTPVTAGLSTTDALSSPARRANMAKALCSESLRSNAHASPQIHGSIGFDGEHAAGHDLKRARTDEVICGLPHEHWDRPAAEAKLI